MSKILDAMQKQIESAYGRPLAEIEAAVPHDREIASFAIPADGASYLKLDLTVRVAYAVGIALLILRPRPRRRILLTETGEVRVAKNNEIATGLMPINSGWCIANLPIEWPEGTVGPVRIWTARELKPGEQA